MYINVSQCKNFKNTISDLAMENAMPTLSNGLEIIENPQKVTPYMVRLECPEFTCLCPRTGQPDFAVVCIHYSPQSWILELKSLKLYLWSFRNVGIFHEAVLNEIYEALYTALEPKELVVKLIFNVRGGITTEVERSCI